MFAPGQAEESWLQAPQAWPKDPSGDPSSEDSLFSGSLISSPRTAAPAPPSAVTCFHSPGPGSARHPWVPCTSAQISLVAPCWSVNLQHTHTCTHVSTRTHMYSHTQHSQPQLLFPYGIFHLLAELINFISCLLGGKSRAAASFPVNHKQQ